MNNATICRRLMVLAAVVGLLGFVAVGCDDVEADNHSHDGVLDEVTELVTVMRPTEGNEAQGVVTFSSANGEVRVTARISGLSPDQEHAIHVHEYGDDRAADGTSAGGHYNPEGHDHALPNDEQRHAGDLGNLQADSEGNAEFELVIDNATLAGHHNPLIGRAVIIHEGRDRGSEYQPTGDAGGRIASGIIGVANPEAD